MKKIILILIFLSLPLLFMQKAEIKDVKPEIYPEAYSEAIVSECKIKIEEHEKEQNEVYEYGCHVLNSDTKCSDLVEPPVTFVTEEDLIGFSNSSIRCKVEKKGDNYELSEDLWVIDLYGK